MRDPLALFAFGEELLADVERGLVDGILVEASIRPQAVLALVLSAAPSRRDGDRRLIGRAGVSRLLDGLLVRDRMLFEGRTVARKASRQSDANDRHRIVGGKKQYTRNISFSDEFKADILAQLEEADDAGLV